MMDCVIVSHFHWDREWYRTFQAFRSRLVDAVDRVLELLEADPGYCFMLDGQTVVLEDYLAIRPAQRERLVQYIGAGRLSIGPWYVQPDSLLPSGEAHVRNLLRGRAVGCSFGPVSRSGYVPDSFGHPAQLPQILRGFGISTFIYWRGNGSEIDELGAHYRWMAPDGSSVTATLLREGYLNAASLPADVDEAVRRVVDVATRLSDDPQRPVLLMNGVDHMFPDAQVGAVAAALQRATGWRVKRGFLEDAVDVEQPCSSTFRGELTGARIANLTPGVWSTRMPLKLLNRRCETLLQAWAEPWAALGLALGAGDERPSLAKAWEMVLKNQAHDSICGCSIDAVADDVQSRFETAESLSNETIDRLLERFAGRGIERLVPWTLEQQVAVFNPSPQARTDVVRVPLDVHPALLFSVGVPEVHPFAFAVRDAAGITVDGQPARMVPADDPSRTRWLPGPGPVDVEFVAHDVPPFGWRHYALATSSAPIADKVDEERHIEVGDLRVRAADDGTLTLRLAQREYAGLLGVEDHGDRGDTYDYDPITENDPISLLSVSCRRFRHPSGMQRLEIVRTYSVPQCLAADREQRAVAMTPLVLRIEVRLAPAVSRVDLCVEVENHACDHRLRLLFPTGATVDAFHAASTFDVVARTPDRRGDVGWVHPAPHTFPHHGWIGANGLIVVAPGLPEAEVTRSGVIAVTLLRSVGWLARFDLRSRPLPAGPFMEVPGAQQIGKLRARLALLSATAPPAAAYDAEIGLRGVIAGTAPLGATGSSLFSMEPAALLLSAFKPAESADGIVVRVLNPSNTMHTAILKPNFRVSSVACVRLDEEAEDYDVAFESGRVLFDVPARALRSVLLRA